MPDVLSAFLAQVAEHLEKSHNKAWNYEYNGYGLIRTDLATAVRLLTAANDVIEASKKIVSEFVAVRDEQHEKLVHHQTLESASKNWNDLRRTIDFQPLVTVLEKWAQAVAEIKKPGGAHD